MYIHTLYNIDPYLYTHTHTYLLPFDDGEGAGLKSPETPNHRHLGSYLEPYFGYPYS